MSYKGIFNPNDIELFGVPRPATEGKTHRVGDRGDESVYVYADGITLAVNVALATDRPLLVRGVSGSGKSSLAKNVAEDAELALLRGRGHLAYPGSRPALDV